MPLLSSLLHRSLHLAARAVERIVDRADAVVTRRDRKDRRVRMLAYAGYRNASEVRVMGRIVRYAEPLNAGKGRLSRLRAMMAIYNSHELPGVAVRCAGYGRTAEATSDAEGYFSFAIAIDTPLPDVTAWEKVTLTTPARDMQQPSVAVPVIAPGTGNHWAIISDIDDTVIETGATNFVKNWRRVLIEQPGDRLAVPGAATLYTTIARDHRAPVRPFFYVSSSPWNLYGFLTEFMQLNGIPHGPMFLKDIGIDRTKFIKAGHDQHKLAAIETVLGFYPGFTFLLIGDNGQKDVDIYARAVADYPGRIGAVFIRDVSGACDTGAKAERLAEIGRRGVPTFCGAGFADAVAIVKALDLERPLEVAKAASPAEPATVPQAAKG